MNFFIPGQVSNIPSSMLADQFGMAGLLVRIRSAETNPDLLDLSYGFNFSSYLDCDESTPVWPTFDGPWSDEKAARLQDIDCDLIPEYRMDMETRYQFHQNITRTFLYENILCSFSLLTFWLCDLSTIISAQKLLVKCEEIDYR